MALTIEDGSGVVGANSYVTPTEARAFAALRGITFPALPASPAVDPVEALLINAMDYLESLNFKGEKNYLISINELAWPRTGVTYKGEAFPEDEIPSNLKKAQIQLAFEAQTTDLMPTGSGKEVIHEKVEGAVEINYAPMGDTAPQPSFTKVDAFLTDLLEDGGSSFSLVTERA